MKAEAQDTGVLGTILAGTRSRLKGRAAERTEWERLAARAQPAPSFVRALDGATVSVIGEVKRRSPSAGAIKEDLDPVALARRYADGGASAISVLTEPAHFGGSIEDLMHVAREVGLPTLRKDFIVDPIQVYEARAVGASAILLIVRALTADELHLLAALAKGIGLTALVEVHSVEEVARAREVDAAVIGVNARDLDTLAMNTGLVESLLPSIAPGCLAVAESGLGSRADVERVAQAGTDAVLVGTALAGAKDPVAATRELVGVIRRKRRWI